MDGTPDILVYPRDRDAYGRLCQLLSRGKLQAEKGECLLTLADLLDFAEGQLLVLMLPHRFETTIALKVLDRLKCSRADGVWLAASMLYRGDDTRRLSRLYRIAATAGVPLLATNDVLYHHPARRPLQDVLTCILEKTTIHAIGKKLQANAERHMKPGDEMVRFFRDLPEAIEETMRFADRITFTLDELKYQYPDEPVPPGKTAQEHLTDITNAGIRHYFPGGIGKKLQATIDKELHLIEKLGYAHYFLTVHDIVQYARDQDIGGEFRRLLHARHHFGESRRNRCVVRTVHLRGTARAARYRCGFRALAPRRSDAIRLPALWPPSRGDCCDCDPLSPAQRHSRCRQGARADGGCHRCVGGHGVGKLGHQRQ
jgi:error-prone DNA polymerase